MPPMMKAVATVALGLVLMVTGAPAASGPQVPSATQRSLFARHYREGETLQYRMTTSNRGATDTLRYTVAADVSVKKDDDGRFYEDIGWHDMIVNGTPFDLPAQSRAFRQQLTLEPNPAHLKVPDLAQVHPILIGPITDLLTFYSDVFVARQGTLNTPGDHFYVKHGTPASWADGRRVLIGEDSIDFDVTLEGLDRTAGTLTLRVRHVPATPPQIKVPADWMQPPVADTPNNWVQVERNANGTETASVGQETFIAIVTLSLTDGRIVTATLDNPVQVRERECENEALTVCGGPIRYEIRRMVDLRIEPPKEPGNGG